MPTEHISIKDAAEIIGVTRQRVSALIAKERLETETVGLVTYVLRSSAIERRKLMARTDHARYGPIPDGYLTTAEAAKRCGCTPSTILNWVTTGQLAAARDEYDPRRWIIKTTDADNFTAPTRGRPRKPEGVNTDA
jgi:excisionase family DNA binding protein